MIITVPPHDANYHAMCPSCRLTHTNTQQERERSRVIDRDRRRGGVPKRAAEISGNRIKQLRVL